MLTNTNSLLLTIGIFAVVAYGLYRTLVQGKLPGIRRFAALEAIDEGIGIAVETGKKVHFGSPGAVSGERATDVLATLAIMGHFATKAAKAGVNTVYSVTTPPVHTVAEGIVRDAYMAEGKLAEFENSEMTQVRLILGRGGTYPTFYAGLMQRDMATSIINASGKFKLFMGEANRQGDVFGICLSPSYDKLEWGIATFDYVLMLSEVYVAGAAITHDAAQLGSAFGMDIVTWVFAALFIVFTGVATALGNLDFLIGG